MKKLLRKKGFTLVECVVAIAVFAIMSSMVMVIMSSAVMTAKKSAEGERDLNNLVEAVEDSETVYRYSSGSDELKMKFAGSGDADPGTNYSITYSKTPGYKDYITCPYCGYYSSFKDFLYRIPYSNHYTAWGRVYPTYQKLKPENFFYPAGARNGNNNDSKYYYPNVTPSTDESGNNIFIVNDGNGTASGAAPFNGTVDGIELGWGQGNLNHFFCPSCEKPIMFKDADTWNAKSFSNDTSSVYTNLKAAYYFRCYDCDNTDSPYYDNKSDRTRKGFHYDRSKCSFYCNKCGSANVMEQHAHDNLGIGADFVVNGIYPNAIIYTPVDRPSDTEYKSLIQAWDSAETTELNGKVSQFSVQEASAAVDDTGAAQTDLYKMKFKLSARHGTIKIRFPMGYDLGNVNVFYNKYESGTRYTVQADTNTLVIYDASDLQDFTFTLTNSKTGNSFDMDYSAKGGLFGYWFRAYDTTEGKGITQFTLPRQELRADAKTSSS